MKSVYCIKYSRCNILKEFQHQMNIDIFAYVICQATFVKFDTY